MLAIVQRGGSELDHKGEETHVHSQISECACSN